MITHPLGRISETGLLGTGASANAEKCVLSEGLDENFSKQPFSSGCAPAG